jgi:ferredoxin
MVITDDCIKCGSCVDECPGWAIREGDGKHIIDQELRGECRSGLDRGPNDAIVEP